MAAKGDTCQVVKTSFHQWRSALQQEAIPRRHLREGRRHRTTSPDPGSIVRRRQRGCAQRAIPVINFNTPDPT